MTKMMIMIQKIPVKRRRVKNAKLERAKRKVAKRKNVRRMRAKMKVTSCNMMMMPIMLIHHRLRSVDENVKRLRNPIGKRSHRLPV